VQFGKCHLTPFSSLTVAHGSILIFLFRITCLLDAIERYTDSLNSPSVAYNIETKTKPEWDGIYTPSPEIFVRLLLKELQKLKIKDRTTIQSFDVRTLQLVHQRDTSIRLALLVSNMDGMQTNIRRLGFTPDVYSPNYQLVTSDLVSDAHREGMELIPWTVNKEAPMRRMIQFGVDGLITDYPNRARAVIDTLIQRAEAGQTR